jgi:hypothetical protein
MVAQVFDISDFSPLEVAAFDYQVRQTLGFFNATEEQAAKSIALPAAWGSAIKAIRDRRAAVGSVRQ